MLCYFELSIWHTIRASVLMNNKTVRIRKFFYYDFDFSHKINLHVIPEKPTFPYDTIWTFDGTADTGLIHNVILLFLELSAAIKK